MFARVSLVGVLLVALAGCVVNEINLYTCPHPDKGHKGPDGEPDPCHEQDPDGGTDGGTDAGKGEDGGEDAHAEPRCVVGKYAHWELPWVQPTLLWFGPPDQAPECPLGSETVSYEGYAD